MKTFTVKDLMVPIEEYVTVPMGTTLLNAVLALEEAQEHFEFGQKYHHRAILVLDDEGKVVGLVSQLRALQAMETKVEDCAFYGQLRRYNFSNNYIEKLREKARMECKVFTEDALKAAAQKVVDDFMKRPTPEEYVDAESELDLAMHKLVAGGRQSLLVTSEDEIVGILRLVDVFSASFHAMKELELT